MAHAGLDISDDAIRFVSYSSPWGHTRVKDYEETALPDGLNVGGDTKDISKFAELLYSSAKKSDLSYVRVSIPEEKAYLFQTDVPNADPVSIRQNIESKLEENVPLSAKDALFYFDIIPSLSGESGDSLRASVSVVPKTYINHMIDMLTEAGMKPVAFETVPKALARVVLAKNVAESTIIIHIMNFKTGIDLVSGGVVCFTSTIMRGGKGSVDPHQISYEEMVASEIHKISDYWQTRAPGQSVKRVIVVGYEAIQHAKSLEPALSDANISVSVSDIWTNILDSEKGVPAISKKDSLEYAVAAGLAMYQ